MNEDKKIETENILKHLKSASRNTPPHIPGRKKASNAFKIIETKKKVFQETSTNQDLKKATRSCGSCYKQAKLFSEKIKEANQQLEQGIS